MLQRSQDMAVMFRLATMLLTLVLDALCFLGLCVRLRLEPAAENLFLRKPLARYQEHHVRPRRTRDVIRIAMSWLGRWFDWRQALAVVQPKTFL